MALIAFLDCAASFNLANVQDNFGVKRSPIYLQTDVTLACTPLRVHFSVFQSGPPFLNTIISVFLN